MVAGFELIPDPFICGGGAPTGTTLYSDSFAGGAWAGAVPITGHGSPDLWHRTTYAGRGTGTGHSANGHMYFGIDAQDNFDLDLRVAGDLVSSTVNFAAGQATYLSFATKWQVEYFNGYDHMWIQIKDLTAGGKTYILCKLNPPARPDGQSSDSTTPACSPEKFGPCPNQDGSLVGLVVPDTDPSAPHWENRYVQIPSFLLGKNIQINFAFDSSDPVSNVFLGWMLDDVTVSTGISATFQAFPTEI